MTGVYGYAVLFLCFLVIKAKYIRDRDGLILKVNK